ncbi:MULTISPECIES: hypothetical protein [unclassified Microcoleus]|uniref:hypothetical protein n=1 Tax=unclassified Microcoleus TaxID=2642155 RepID=UPI002FD79C45
MTGHNIIPIINNHLTLAVRSHPKEKSLFSKKRSPFSQAVRSPFCQQLVNNY